MAGDLLYFQCPACGKSTSAPFDSPGQTLRCGECANLIVVPGAPASQILTLPDDPVASPATPAAARPSAIVPAKPVPIEPLIDISKIPGLRTRVARPREVKKTYGIAHRPGTTFGHAFGGSFGCVFGVYMAILASAIVFAIVAAVASKLSAP